MQRLQTIFFIYLLFNSCFLFQRFTSMLDMTSGTQPTGLAGVSYSFSFFTLVGLLFPFGEEVY